MELLLVEFYANYEGIVKIKNSKEVNFDSSRNFIIAATKTFNVFLIYHSITTITIMKTTSRPKFYLAYSEVQFIKGMMNT
jgi:hypothetical protein